MTQNKQFHSLLRLLKETVIISTELISNAIFFLIFCAEPIKFPVGFKLFLKYTVQDTLLLNCYLRMPVFTCEMPSQNGFTEHTFCC